MKKVIYVILSLVVVSGQVFTSCENKKGPSKKPTPKSLSIAEMKAERKKWEASPDGIMIKKWEASPAGKKIFASEAKIRKSITEFTNMEAVVTSLSLPPGSRLGFGVMIKINEDDYILSFGLNKPKNKEFQQLHNLKVNDKIIIRSRSVMHAPKYLYPIVSGDYVEQNGKRVYKRPKEKNGC